MLKNDFPNIKIINYNNKLIFAFLNDHEIEKLYSLIYKQTMESKPNSLLNNKSINSNNQKTKNNFKSNNSKTTKNKISNSNKINNQINSRINNTDTRPINSSGRYNLNFIDWNNEWERVNEVILKIENGEKIEDKEEEQRIRNCLNKEKEKNGITIKAFEIVVKPDTKKECYICLKNFCVKTKIRRLFCKHMFCEECLLPWIKYNSKCPVCKFDFKQKDQNEDDHFDYEINSADI